MSSLQVILSEKAKLMEEVASQFGEVTDEQVATLNELDLAIPAKIDSWALFLKEDIPDQIKKMKSKIQEYKDAIEKLEAFKEKKELYLHNLLKGNGLEEINGEEKRIVADVSVRRSIREYSDIVSSQELMEMPIEYGTYTITLTFPQYEELEEKLQNAEISKELNCALYKDAKHKVNVTDLPEDHPAIVKSIRPTVKILKAKK